VSRGLVHWSQIDSVIRCIQNQRRHHARRTFREEYPEFLRRFGVDYDERYISKTECDADADPGKVGGLFEDVAPAELGTDSEGARLYKDTDPDGVLGQGFISA